MKKLLLTLTLTFLGFAAAHAQSLGYVEGLLTEAGIPYNVVDAFDTGGNPNGNLVPDPSGVRESLGFFYEGPTSIYFLSGKAFSRPTDSQGMPTNWSTIANPQQGTVFAQGQQSGYSPILIKVKGTGVLKPVQIRSDGGRIMIFGTDGYVYHFNVAISSANGQTILVLLPGNGQN